MAFRAFRSQGYVGGKKQTAQGTAIAPDNFAKYLRAGYDPEQDVSYYRNPNGRDNTYGVKERVKWAGSFQTPLYPDEGAEWLTWGLGADTISGAGDPYTHTIAMQDNLPYITVEIGRGEDLSVSNPALPISGVVHRVQDCKVNGITVEGEASKLVLMTVDLAGITSAMTATPATVTYTDGVSEGPMMFHQGTFTITGLSSTATYGENALIATQVKKMQMKAMQNIDYVFASQFVAIGLVEQARDLSLTFDAVFDGPSLYAVTYNTGTQYAGIATAATATTLTDSAATFGTLTGSAYLIRITGGLGQGQMRLITANTGTQVTVATWTVTPDTTSTYEIFNLVPASVLNTGTFDVKFISQSSPEHSVDLNMAAIYWEQVKTVIDPANNTMIMSITAKPRRSGATMPLAVVAKNAISAGY